MSKSKLDNINRKILIALQRNGKLTNAELAVTVGLSQTPCLRRVRQLEEDGIITGYSAIVDQAAVGLPVSVFAQVTMQSHDSEVLERFDTTVRNWTEVLECYLMTGRRDYLLRIVVEDVAAYERFIKEKLTRLPGVGSIESSFALKQVKHVTAVPI
ncbi:MAG TPA: Lrp/AsnC family transcriptional regulator [Methylomirabilota bacterium]|nr:Lrp/AsnC family transcriptional regulator [Methylomirabilota bacterium]